MKTSEFKEYLAKRHIYFTQKDIKIIIEGKVTLALDYLETFTENVIFNNNGSLWFSCLKVIPKGTQFNNRGLVIFNRLEELTEDAQFNNSDLVLINKRYLKTPVPDHLKQKIVLV